MARFDIESLKKFRRRIGYFAGNFIAYYTPGWLYKPYWRLRFAMLSDRLKQQALPRVDYYVRLGDNPQKLTDIEPRALSDERGAGAIGVSVGEYKRPRGKRKFTTYFYDLYPVVRMFDKHLKFSYLFGDINYETTMPTLVKSRPIPKLEHSTDTGKMPVLHGLTTLTDTGKMPVLHGLTTLTDTGKMPVLHGLVTESVLCRLDSIRHFMYVNDHTPWREKKDMLISRAYVCKQPHRTLFMERTIDSPMCDVGQINLDEEHPEFHKPFVTIPDHLKYKFIACIEGHDVASNLKWVMSSNSLAVMPRPKIESWFMEGTLIPNYHYVEIKDDYSDVEERMRYYIEHPDEAEAIIEHAHEYVARFRNATLERWVMYQTLERYFKLTN